VRGGYGEETDFWGERGIRERGRERERLRNIVASMCTHIPECWDWWRAFVDGA
jgi:hypothetical protein